MGQGEDTFQKVSDTKKIVSEGAATIGKLVAAISVVKLLVRGLEMPLSSWLSAALNAYTTVFHPVVDYTVGLVPMIFGQEFLPWVKDLIVIYALFGSALARVGRANATYYEPDIKDATKLEYVFGYAYLAVVWPLMLRSQVRVVREAAAFEALAKAEGLPLRSGWRVNADKAKRNVQEFKKELLIVFGMAAAAVFLNAVGLA
jgi:hypothetical protein